MASYQSSMWSPPDDSLQLANGDVHIWRWTLQKAAQEVASLKMLLSSDEVARAERFYFARHHDAFIAARAGLRVTLARYLETAPEAIAFRYGDAGKPELGSDSAGGESATGELVGGEFAFNLSHSGDWAVCAIARQGPLGIDIERVRAMNDAAGLARRYFAAAEVAVWESIAAEEQIAAFFRCWTRKEAYLKALGDGLRAPLDRFIVSFAPGESPRLVEASPHDQHRNWTIENLDVDPGYAAGIVLPAGLQITRYFAID